jgi:hypothetical protein
LNFQPAQYLKKFSKDNFETKKLRKKKRNKKKKKKSILGKTKTIKKHVKKKQKQKKNNNKIAATVKNLRVLEFLLIYFYQHFYKL